MEKDFLTETNFGKCFCRIRNQIAKHAQKFVKWEHETNESCQHWLKYHDSVCNQDQMRMTIKNS